MGLTIMMKKGYIGEFEMVDDKRAGKIVINLKGRLNKCGVISPRFDVKTKDFDFWSQNLLPSRQFGHIVLTTSSGIMTLESAKRNGIGGKILGFFYRSPQLSPLLHVSLLINIRLFFDL